jgi:tetratricopeptide (TPR) repeat protein
VTESRYVAALEAHDAGDLDRAETLLREVMEAEPDRARVKSNLARVLVDGRRFPEAIRLAKRGVALAPDDLYVHALLVEVLSSAGREDEAIEAASHVPSPKDGEEGMAARVKIAVASARLARDDDAGALSDALVAVRYAPESADAHLVLARALAIANRLGDAVKAIARAREIAPGADAIAEIASVIDEAIANAEGMLAEAEDAPRAIEDWITIAALRLALGRTDAGIDALDRAVALDRENPEVWLARGEVLRRAGVFPLDVAAYHEAERLRG